MQGTTADADALVFKSRNGIAKADLVFITQKEMIHDVKGQKGKTKYVTWHTFMKPYFAGHAMREPCTLLICNF